MKYLFVVPAIIGAWLIFSGLVDLFLFDASQARGDLLLGAVMVAPMTVLVLQER